MVALNALPSACVGRTLNQALDLVLDALPRALDCQLVVIDVPGPQRRREGVWCGARVGATCLAEIDAAVASAEASAMLVYASNPLHWLEAAMPVGNEYGRLLVARRAPFEEDTDRVLVQSAANLAGTALGSANVLEAARRKDQFIATLLEAVTDYAIFMLDVTGHVATWNAGAKATKGYEPQEIIGKHFSIFYTDEDRKAGKPEAILKAVQRDGRVEDESWRVRKDGSRFWANVVITALRDQKSAITGFVKVTRDLTQRRAAEETQRRLLREQAAREAAEAGERRVQESEARYRALSRRLEVILEGIGEGVTVQDRSGRLVYANTAGARLCGVSTPEELLQAPVADVIASFEVLDENGTSIFPDRFPGRRVLKGEAPERLLMQVRDKSTGRKWWTRVNATPILGEDGAPDLAVNILRDVTAEHEQRTRERFLAEATTALGGSLAYDDMMATLAQRLVPGMADWCSVYVKDKDRLRHVITAHRDDAKRALAR